MNRIANLHFALLALSIAGAQLPAAAAADKPSDKAASRPDAGAAASLIAPGSMKKFEQAVERTESLQLPINKVFLYRQAAVALAATDKPRAITLLKRALSDIDSAEASMKAKNTLDDVTYKQLEFHRLPVIMLMERIDPVEALGVLAPPQTADRDTAFQALFFQRLKNPDMVRDAAMHKLDYGVTPAVVSAYEVLQKTAPGAARTLATAIVMKLGKTDPSSDPAAVQSAFALLRLLRTDVGSLAPAMVLDSGLLSPDLVHGLFNFIGDAFLASNDPEMLILGEKPGVYVAALEEYAPDKAQDVKLLPFAAPDAVSLIMKPETPVYDANHPDPATLTPEQEQQRAAMKAQIDTQIKETEAQTRLLTARIKQQELTQKERDDAVFSIVDQANRAISLARSSATVLDHESFRNGEFEFYNMGPISTVIDEVSTVLQGYVTEHPKVAEVAAQKLDGPEVQAEVGLQVAIKELTGHQAYLVIQPKPPGNASRPAAALAPAVPVPSVVPSTPSALR